MGSKDNVLRAYDPDRKYTVEEFYRLTGEGPVELINGHIYDPSNPVDYDLWREEKREGRKYTVEEYYALTGEDRVELIYGYLYYMAPPSREHQKLASELHFAVLSYIKKKGGPCEVYPAPFGVKLFPGDEDGCIVEPDLSVICDKEKLDERGCNGAPDWVIEIASPSDPARDYLEKLNLYKRAGVREYWIVNPMDKNVSVYWMENGAFDFSAYSFQDRIKVGIYDDLWIDMKELRIS